MFWKKKAATSQPKVEKLKGPKDIPDIVGGHLVTDFNQNPDLVWKLKAVKRRRQESKDAFDVRVFDDVEAAASKVKVKDYTTLDEHPELILYEGWFDLESRQLQLEEKKTA
jgi:hypothetical protein